MTKHDSRNNKIKAISGVLTKTFRKSSDLHLRSSIIPTPPTRCVGVLELGQKHTCALTSSAAFTAPPAIWRYVQLQPASFTHNAPSNLGWAAFMFYFFFPTACCLEDVLQRLSSGCKLQRLHYHEGRVWILSARKHSACSDEQTASRHDNSSSAGRLLSMVLKTTVGCSE